MPLYETSEHLAEEELMKLEFEQQHNCKLEKLPMKYSLDYALCRGIKGTVITGFIELKRRHEMSTHHEYYLIDAHKIKEAQILWQTFELPSVLVVKYNDRTGWIKIADETSPLKDCRLIMTGRRDRNDPNDFQPFVQIPVKSFKGLS